MYKENLGGIVILPPEVMATNATTQLSFSKVSNATGQPFDHAVIDVILSTHASTTAVLQTLILAESDTLTSPTSMTDILAFSGSATTSATHAFIVPTIANTDTGGVIELQVDLKRRKKFVGVKVYGSLATCTVAIIARLTSGKVAAVSAAQKTLRNYSNTAAAGCLTLVNDATYTTAVAPTS